MPIHCDEATHPSKLSTSIAFYIAFEVKYMISSEDQCHSIALEFVLRVSLVQLNSDKRRAPRLWHLEQLSTFIIFYIVFALKKQP